MAQQRLPVRYFLPQQATIAQLAGGIAADELARLTQIDYTREMAFIAVAPGPDGAPQTQRILNSIAVGRMGTPEDVARAALFFLSPDNGFVTGQVLYVCGGTTLGVAPV